MMVSACWTCSGICEFFCTNTWTIKRHWVAFGALLPMATPLGIQRKAMYICYFIHLLIFDTTFSLSVAKRKDKIARSIVWFYRNLEKKNTSNLHFFNQLPVQFYINFCTINCKHILLQGMTNTPTFILFFINKTNISTYIYTAQQWYRYGIYSINLHNDDYNQEKLSITFCIQ